MFDVYLTLGVQFILIALSVAVKNPQSKATMKKSFYRVFTQIVLLYPEFLTDPRVQAKLKKKKAK